MAWNESLHSSVQTNLVFLCNKRVNGAIIIEKFGTNRLNRDAVPIIDRTSHTFDYGNMHYNLYRLDPEKIHFQDLREDRLRYNITKIR